MLKKIKTLIQKVKVIIIKPSHDEDLGEPIELKPIKPIKPIHPDPANPIPVDPPIPAPVIRAKKDKQ